MQVVAMTLRDSIENVSSLFGYNHHHRYIMLDNYNKPVAILPCVITPRLTRPHVFKSEILLLGYNKISWDFILYSDKRYLLLLLMSDGIVKSWILLTT